MIKPLPRLRLNTGILSNREYFENLKGKDRRNLTDLLCKLRDKGIGHVTVRGSSLLGDRNYNDIDLLVDNRYHRFVFFNAIGESYLEVGDKMIIKSAFEGTEQKYMGTVVQDRVQLNYKGTDIDIARDKISLPKIV